MPLLTATQHERKVPQTTIGYLFINLVIVR